MNQHLYIDERGRLSARVSRGRRLRSGTEQRLQKLSLPGITPLSVLKRRICIFCILSSETEKFRIELDKKNGRCGKWIWSGS